MMTIDEDALVCDLAEVYHIYDYESLPIMKVATFSLGLRADSRIKLKMSGGKLPLDSRLLALIVDDLNTLVWFQSKDGANNVNRPESIYKNLISAEPEKKKVDSFKSSKDFERERQKILNEMKGG